jgi:threonine dehydrogenase-like Zn-dependent dehydrogenase
MRPAAAAGRLVIGFVRRAIDSSGQRLDEPALTLRTGQPHVRGTCVRLLADRARRARPDAGDHTASLAEAPHGYDIFKNKADGCEKVVLKP